MLKKSLNEDERRINKNITIRSNALSCGHQLDAMVSLQNGVGGIMGCDIHLFVEYKRKEDKQWWNFGKQFLPGRNYSIFGRMAGVRGTDEPISEPRGIPKDVAWTTEEENTLFVTDEKKEESGYVDKETAQKWIKEGLSEKYDEHRITHPDWHSHSWLNKNEFAEAIKEYKGEEQYMAILAVMDFFETAGYECRVVFWFDN